MAELKTPGTGLRHGELENAAEVLLSVVVGMGLVLVLAFVLMIEKCVTACASLGERFRRPLPGARPSALICDANPHPGGSVSSLNH